MMEAGSERYYVADFEDGGGIQGAGECGRLLEDGKSQ